MIQKYFLDVLKYRYIEFVGRSSLKEFWYFVLFKWLSLISLVLLSRLLMIPFMKSGNLDTLFLINKLTKWSFIIAYLCILLPSLAITVRRLHDVGKTGLLVLLKIVPGLGTIVLFLFLVQEGSAAPNKYGPSLYS